MLYEYPLGLSARLASSMKALGMMILSAGGIGFLLALGVMLTLGEVANDVFTQWNLDAVSRALIGILFLELLLGLAVYAVADTWFNWAFVGQLSRAAVTSPDRVPPVWQRQYTRMSTPNNGVNATIGTVLGSATIVALIMLAIFDESNDKRGSLIVIGALLAAVAISSLLLVVLKKFTRRTFPDRVAPSADAFTQERATRAASHDERRKPANRARVEFGRGRSVAQFLSRWGGRAALALALGGAAFGMIGVYLRQPCRYCDERTLNTFGENSLDAALTVGLVIVAFGIFSGAVATVARLALAGIENRALRRADASARPQTALLVDRLTSPSALTSTATIIGAAAALAITSAAVSNAVAAHTEDSGSLLAAEPLLSAIMAGAIAVLAVCVIVDFSQYAPTTRFRNELRDKWAPGDVAPTTPPNAQKNTKKAAR
ncbi:MAG: hypothetical protein ACOH1T_07015 [Microbacteriaceae bacterium]